MVSRVSVLTQMTRSSHGLLFRKLTGNRVRDPLHPRLVHPLPSSSEPTQTACGDPGKQVICRGYGRFSNVAI
jgi:hypothetical protein